MAIHVRPTILFVVLVTLCSVAAQTFQYSRGWTNGKRDGRKKEDIREVANSFEKILGPCQMSKLKYILEGKPVNERLFAPCNYVEEDDIQTKRYKNERNVEPQFDVFL